MINHVDVKVKDLSRSKTFYIKVLEPLGYKVCFDFPSTVSFSDSISSDPGGDFYLNEGEPARFHLAFQAENHLQVVQFYTNALKLGGKDNGAPGYRPHYHENYYACYIIDPDGYPIECVCHEDVAK